MLFLLRSSDQAWRLSESAFSASTANRHWVSSEYVRDEKRRKAAVGKRTDEHHMLKRLGSVEVSACDESVANTVELCSRPVLNSDISCRRTNYLRMPSRQRYTGDSSYTRFSPSVIGVSRPISFFSKCSIRACCVSSCTGPLASCVLSVLVVYSISDSGLCSDKSIHLIWRMCVRGRSGTAFVVRSTSSSLENAAEPSSAASLDEKRREGVMTVEDGTRQERYNKRSTR